MMTNVANATRSLSAFALAVTLGLTLLMGAIAPAMNNDAGITAPAVVAANTVADTAAA